MKKTLAVLLTMLLCLCAAACVSNANAQAADPTEQTTEAPTLETYTGPTIEFEHPTIDINVPTPDEMPTKPEYDYSIPPGERPGDQVEPYDQVKPQ